MLLRIARPDNNDHHRCLAFGKQFLDLPGWSSWVSLNSHAFISDSQCTGVGNTVDHHTNKQLSPPAGRLQERGGWWKRYCSDLTNSAQQGWPSVRLSRSFPASWFAQQYVLLNFIRLQTIHGVSVPISDDVDMSGLVFLCMIAVTLMLIYGAVKGKPSHLLPFFCLQIFDFAIAT